MSIKQEIIDRLASAVGEAIDRHVSSSRQQGFDFNRSCFDETSAANEFEAAVVGLDDTKLTGVLNANSGTASLSDLFEAADMDSQFSSVEKVFEAHYAEPGERVWDWTEKHLTGDDGRGVNTEYWLRENANHDNSGYWLVDGRELEDWDLVGAAKRIDAHLLALAENGSLDLDEDTEQVFDESFWTQLHVVFAPTPLEEDAE